MSGKEHLEVHFKKWVRLWEEKGRFRLKEAEGHYPHNPAIIKNT